MFTKTVVLSLSLSVGLMATSLGINLKLDKDISSKIFFKDQVEKIYPNLFFKNKPKKICEGIFKRDVVYFADEHDPHNRLLVLDYKNMKLLKEIPLNGSLNHHADLAGTLKDAPYVVTIPKGSNFIAFYNIKNGEFVKKIRLPFRPRSADAYNKRKDLLFLNSRDRPAGVIIDTKAVKIVGKLGFNIDCRDGRVITNKEIKNLVCTTNDFGGDQISGHPIWLSARSVALLDRANRYIHVFKLKRKKDIYDAKLIQSIPTDTSLHQMIPLYPKRINNRIFFGETESNVQQKKYAGVYKFIRRGDKLKVKNFTYLKYKNIIGIYGHNLYITPNKKFLYAPAGATITKEGVIKKGGIFVVDTKSMKVIKFIQTGFGAGHVAFARKKGIAIVTNHKDEYVSAINWKKHQFIKNIQLPFEHEGIASLNQSHSQYIDKEEDYYYNFWSDGGEFFKINLDSLEVEDELYVGGVPIQGNFVEKVTTRCNIPTPAPEDGFDEFFSDFKNDLIDSTKTLIGIGDKSSTSNKSSLEINGYDDSSKDFVKGIEEKLKAQHQNRNTTTNQLNKPTK